MKFGAQVKMTLLLDKINGSTLGNICFRHFGLNQIWPPLNNVNDHISVTSWPIVNISVCIIMFSRVLSPSERYFVKINNVLTK